MSKTAAELLQAKTDFNTEWWNSYNEARRTIHEAITKAQNQFNRKKQQLTEKFIQSAIQKAGKAELSDQMIIDRVEWDRYRKIWVVIPEVYGVIPEKIKPFHAQAMLRNMRDEYKIDLLAITQIFTGKAPPLPDATRLEKLKNELYKLDDLKEKAPQGHSTVIPHANSPVMAMEEIHDYIQRVYPDREVKRMTIQEAQEIMEQQTGGNVNNFMTAEEMGRHIRRQAGDDEVTHFGPKGREVIQL